MHTQTNALENHYQPPVQSGPGENPDKSAAPFAGQSLSELDQLVTIERLREIVWESASRPSVQWLRKETKRRMIPHVRRGRLIYYIPRSVLAWYAQKESRPASMK